MPLQDLHADSVLRHRITSFLSRKGNREALANYLYLFSVQGANYLLPLLTVPYIARTISPENFGKIAVVQAFISYFTLIINFGFEFTATRAIASNQGNTSKLNEIASQTFSSKAWLLILSTAVFSIISLTVPAIKQDALLYWAAYLVNVGFFLTPNWYLHGTGRLKFLAILNLLIKLLFTVLIFVLVTADEDTLLIPLSTSIANIALGLFGLAWILKKDKVRLTFVSIGQAYKALQAGGPIFLSTLAVNFYTTSNILLIGFLGNESSTANFTASSRLVTIVAATIIAPVSLTLFPILAKKMAFSVKEGIATIHKLALYLGLASAVVSLVLFLFAQFIISLIYGDQYPDTYLCLKIVAIVPFLVTINNIYGTQGVLNLKMDKAFFGVTLAGAILSIGLNLLLIPGYREYGTASAWVMTEFFITISFFLLFIRKSKQYLTKPY